MKTVIQLVVICLVAVIVAVFHPFQLAMPWQTGGEREVDLALLSIMEPHDYKVIDTEVGRLTPFNYTAATGSYTTTANVSETCVELEASLNRWGLIVETQRRAGGCFFEADALGPMTATVEVTEDPDQPRLLDIAVRVQHTP